MKRDIPIAQLMPCDILLYRSEGLIGDAIRLIDRSQVSHASLFIGRYGEKGRTVGEAIREGVVRRELSKSMEHTQWVEARRLKEPPASLDPVLGRADFYLQRGERYAFEQILLLAFLCITRNLVDSPALGGLIRETLDAAAGFLLSLFDTGREPMICSEFVFRCYSESLPGEMHVYARAPGVDRPREGEVPFRARKGIHRGSALFRLLEGHGGRLRDRETQPLRVQGPSGTTAVEERIEAYVRDLRHRKPGAARVDLTSPELSPSFERFAASFHLVRHRPEKTEAPRAAVMEGLFDAAADFVTPGDLQRSRSLSYCGKLRHRE